MKIELFYWDGCPSYPEAHELLRSVLDERGVGDEIELREVTSNEEAQELGFPGSPTIRIDGRDLVPHGSDEPTGLHCRVYRLRDGRFSPTPDPEDLRAAVARAIA